MINRSILAFLLLIPLLISGCAALQPFPTAARAGDTISLVTGWKHEFSRDKITVTITPSSGSPIVYQPNDPHVRAVINLYADPASYMAVGWETNRISPEYKYGATYGSVASYRYTNNDPDWWQTAVIIDLPPDLPIGMTEISITSSGGMSESYGPVPLEILEGTGEPNPFKVESLTSGLSEPQLQTLERAPLQEISLTSDVIPYAVQIDMHHDLDMDNDGVGRAQVVNPRGDIKNVSWKDDGESLRVMVMPTKNKVLKDMVRFKFYVSGGVENLNIVDTKAYDIDGNEVSGVTAIIK